MYDDNGKSKTTEPETHLDRKDRANEDSPVIESGEIEARRELSDVINDKGSLLKSKASKMNEPETYSDEEDDKATEKVKIQTDDMKVEKGEIIIAGRDVKKETSEEDDKATEKVKIQTGDMKVENGEIIIVGRDFKKEISILGIPVERFFEVVLPGVIGVQIIGYCCAIDAQIHKVDMLTWIIICYPTIFGLVASLGFLFGLVYNNKRLKVLGFISVILCFGTWIFIIVGGALRNMFPFLDDFFARLLPQYNIPN